MLAPCPVQLYQMLSMWDEDEDDLILCIRSKMMSSKNRRVPFHAQVPRFLQILDPSYNTSCAQRSEATLEYNSEQHYYICCR